MKKKKVVDPRYAKSEEYQDVINQIAAEEKCPFCPDNFRYHKNPILKRAGDWFVTASSWPYENTKHHFLIIGTVHKEELTELTPGDWTSITSLANYVIKDFKLPGGGIMMRFGDTTYTGATVCHLHAHIIVPKLKPEEDHTETVWFPIG